MSPDYSTPAPPPPPPRRIEYNGRMFTSSTALEAWLAEPWWRRALGLTAHDRAGKALRYHIGGIAVPVPGGVPATLPRGRYIPRHLAEQILASSGRPEPYPDADLVRRAVLSAHLGRAKATRAEHVAFRFGLGPSLSRTLCERFGLNPAEILDSDRPSAPAVFLHLIDIVGADNGHPLQATPDDHEAAIPYIEALIDAGYFRDDPTDIDGSFWLAAAGECSEALEYFDRAAEAYIGLDVALNSMFERGDP